jgi:DNA repair protein RecN (Recombination protein N)
MLRHLQIRDFAIIEAVELEFAPGLTVLTGETGAGKSILVDALEFLAGGRAGADYLRAGAERADVSATLDVAADSTGLRVLLESQAIDAGSELVLRRVLGSDGRSRCWINGQSVPLQLLRGAAAQLIDIHGQHEFQSLLRESRQRQLVDHFGQHDQLASAVLAAHGAWASLVEQSQQLERAADERESRLELLRFQLQELAALHPSSGELEELQAERSRAAHHSRLVEAARLAHDVLYDSEAANAHGLMSRAVGALRAVEAHDAELAAVLPPLAEAAQRVKEAAQSLAHYLHSLELDPLRLDAIERRLAALEELARKHRVAATALPEKQQALAAELAALEDAAASLDSIRTREQDARAAYQVCAQALSEARARAARRLGAEVSTRMQELGMAGARFIVAVNSLATADPAPTGSDRIEFQVAANPGQEPRPLARVASGGELSRLSLAVQVSCLRDTASCMVFDEVDAGIGGGVAEIVGRELRELGSGGQVLCVTHLPQVAAQGHQHFKVVKQSDGKTTRTSVQQLRDQQRVEEISRMLGGMEITARARAHAAEMLGSAARTSNPASAAYAGSRPAGIGRRAPGRGP